ncbi:hypothetical protein RsoM2USA_354 [Ralstonia phage RsoM2USA]|nr:hypothetical protein RsoM2USA_354 [Ralstonia phage RsoM2USA]
MTDKTVLVDEKLQAALDFSKFKFHSKNQKDAAHHKLKENLTIAINGGSFDITPELIMFTDFHVRSKKASFYLIDLNENPILIDDPKEFLKTITTKYHDSMNAYFVEYSKIRRARQTLKLIDNE